MSFTLFTRRISSLAVRRWASSASVRRELPFDDPREPTTATMPCYDPLALPAYEIFQPSVANSRADNCQPSVPRNTATVASAHTQQAQAPAPVKTRRGFFSSALQLELAESLVALPQPAEAKIAPAADLLQALHDEAQGAIASATSIADAANEHGFTPACSSGAVSSRWVSAMRARQLRSLQERSDSLAAAEC